MILEPVGKGLCGAIRQQIYRAISFQIHQDGPIALAFGWWVEIISTSTESLWSRVDYRAPDELSAFSWIFNVIKEFSWGLRLSQPTAEKSAPQDKERTRRPETRRAVVG
jgi:hypothetical protein